jgi:hypothetical protein
MNTEIKERHYKKILELVPRTQQDISDRGLAARALAQPFVAEFLPAKPEKPVLIPSADGQIERLLLTIPRYAVQESPLASAYNDLLAKMQGDLQTIILTHESVLEIVTQWFNKVGLGEKATFITAPDHLHFSVWAQDAYVVCHDLQSTHTYFVEPYTFPRYADGLIADFVSNATDLENTQAPLYFQGGNVLIGDDFFLIGADYPAKSLEYIRRVIIPKPGETSEALIKRLFQEYFDHTRKIIYVGSTVPVPSQVEQDITINGENWKEIKFFGNHEGTSQPLFHIDMFITLTGRGSNGKYRMLVGDPNFAAKTLGQPLWPHAMQEVFDNIAKGLTRLGFEVIRNPLPLVYLDDPTERLRLWYFATGNNAMVQITSSGSKVWLPCYGFGNWKTLKATDELNAKIWTDLGFSVSMLGDFHPFAENLGAVHCINKYLSRK